jgi:hypothetical protein
MAGGRLLSGLSAEKKNGVAPPSHAFEKWAVARPTQKGVRFYAERPTHQIAHQIMSQPGNPSEDAPPFAHFAKRRQQTDRTMGRRMRSATLKATKIFHHNHPVRAITAPLLAPCNNDFRPAKPDTQSSLIKINRGVQHARASPCQRSANPPQNRPKTGTYPENRG